MKCARCADTIITDAPAPFCSHCWDDFGDFLGGDLVDSDQRRMIADGGRRDEVWNPQLPDQNNESEFRFARIGHSINSLLLIGLSGLYIGNLVVSWEGLPGLSAVFPYVAAFGLIVLSVGVGVDIGILAADGGDDKEVNR